MSSNLARSPAVVIMLPSVFFFPITEGHLLMPIEPVQILWVNLVVAISLALPLAFEALEPGLMDQQPRPPYEPLLGPFLILRTISSAGSSSVL